MSDCAPNGSGEPPVRNEMTRVWREFLCWLGIIEWCHHERAGEMDDLVRRYNHLERRIASERRQWMPRDVYRLDP